MKWENANGRRKVYLKWQNTDGSTRSYEEGDEFWRQHIDTHYVLCYCSTCTMPIQGIEISVRQAICTSVVGVRDSPVVF